MCWVSARLLPVRGRHANLKSALSVCQGFHETLFKLDPRTHAAGGTAAAREPGLPRGGLHKRRRTSERNPSVICKLLL